MNEVTIKNRQVEKLLRNLTPDSTIAIYLLQDGKFQIVNRQFQRLTGYEENELLGMDLSKLVFADDKNMVKENALEMLEGKRSSPYQYRIVSRSGKITWVSETVTPIQSRNEQAVLGRVVDIVEDKEVKQETPWEKSERYKLLVDNSKGILFIFSKNGKILFINKRALADFGYLEDEIIGRSIIRFLSRDYIKKVLYATIAQNFSGSSQNRIEIQVKTKSGEIKYLEVDKRPTPIYRKEKLFGVVLNAFDITEHKRERNTLQKSKERYKKLWDDAPAAYHMLDTKGVILSVNKTEAGMLGYAPEEMIGKPIFEFILPEQQTEAKKRFKLKISDYHLPKAKNRTYVKKDGSKIYVCIDDVLEKDKKNEITGIRTTMVDVNEYKQAEETAKKLAYYDSLTGLPNRRLFNNRLELELNHAQRNQQKLAVMLLDLDYFKKVNDTLGHKVGDDLLKDIGSRLSTLLRKSDTVARMGGDEFMLLLPEIDEVKDTTMIAQKTLKAIREPFVIGSHKLNVTVSIGIAIYPDNGKTSESLIENADTAMYCVKEKGRDNYEFFHPSTSEITPPPTTDSPS